MDDTKPCQLAGLFLLSDLDWFHKMKGKIEHQILMDSLKKTWSHLGRVSNGK